MPGIVAAQSVLGEIIITGNVTVNRIKATSGTTFFSGSQIETFDPGAAIVHLRQGAGVIALEPNTVVNLSGSLQHLTAEVPKGKVTVRAKSPVVIATPQLRVESDADSTCVVMVSREGTEVEPLTREVRVRVGAASVIVRPGERYSSQSRTAAATGTQHDQQEKSKTKRRVIGIIVPLIMGAVALPVALVVASGEKTPPVSPTTPRP
jgi:hypothetical protein